MFSLYTERHGLYRENHADSEVPRLVFPSIVPGGPCPDLVQSRKRSEVRCKYVPKGESRFKRNTAVFSAF